MQIAATQHITVSDGLQLVEQVFTTIGLPANAAKSVARSLVMAEAEGQVGHGFSRIGDYVAQAKSGKISTTAQPTLKHIGASYAVLDADNGFAYPALDLAIDALSQMTTETGCAAISLVNSNHCGALSLQVERLAEAGLVGLMVANAPAAIAPWGGNTPIYGTNPIAFAAPRTDGPPLVIDLSLSKVARGKIMNAHKQGKDIPEGWALDPDGNPTTSPAAALDGTMLPIGEAKGTALILIVEILAAVLGGAHGSKDMSSFFGADGPPTGAGQFLLAFKPASAEGFAQRLEALLQEISNMDGARLPGSRRIAQRVEAEANGLSVPSNYIEQAKSIIAVQ